MSQYSSGRQRNLNVGISSFSENSTVLDVVGNVVVNFGKIGVGTTAPSQDVDVRTIRIRDTLYVNTGIVTDLNAQTGIITNLVSVAGTIGNFNATTGIITNVVGVSGTFNELNVNIGVVTNFYGTNIVGDNLSVSGLSTLGGIGTVGIVTVVGDLYIGANLYTKGILYFDSVGAQYLDVIGVGTIQNGFINNVAITSAFVNYSTGIAATITNLNATNLVASAASFSILNVSGVSTFNNGPVLIGSGTSTGTSNQRLQVGGNAFISGNLGVGTTIPSASFNVVGTSRFNGWGYFTDSVGIGTTNNVELRHYNVNNGTFSVNNNGGNQMLSVSNIPDNTHEFKINQYVGVGTTTGSTRSVFTIDTNGAVSTLFPVNIAVGQSNNYRSEFNNVIWGEVNVRAPYSAIGSSEVVKIVPKYLDRGALSFEAPVGTALTDRGTQIFSISNNLTSTIFRINDTNRNTILEATSSGNVGIGTTLPDRKFQVVGTTRITSVGSTSNEQIDINHYRNTAYPLAGSQPTVNTGAISFDSPAGISTNGISLFPASLFAVTNDPTGNIFSVAGYRYFSGSPWPVIDVTQNGRLGIGTTTPQQEVHIVRNTLINADVTIVGGASSNVIIGGNVGIGTTSLLLGLDVNNTAQFRSRVAFSQTGNPSVGNVFDFTPITSGITTWAPSGGALVITENRNNSGQTSGQIYTLENNDETLFRVNSVGFGVTTVSTPTTPIYQVIDVNPSGEIRLFDTETRKILSTAPGFSSTVPGDGDFLRIDTYVTPFIGSFPTVSKAIRLDKFGLIELNRNVCQISGNTIIGSSTSTGTSSQNLQVIGGAYVSSNVGIGTTLPRARLDVEGGLNVTGVSTVGLGTTSSPTVNSSFSFELTNNTTLTVRVRGTDGVVRTGIITLV